MEKTVVFYFDVSLERAKNVSVSIIAEPGAVEREDVTSLFVMA
jgi:hypothetical protein